MSRVNISKLGSAAYTQLQTLNTAVADAAAAAGLDAKLVELIKIRVSQINGCAFCCRMHTRDAVQAGETADRLAVLPAWWESQYFSEFERSALGLAEEVVKLSAPADEGWDTGTLSPEQVSAVSWLAIVMGAWNRLAIRSGYRVAP